MAVGELSLLVHNPGTPVANGVQLTCYGPFVPPAHARALFKFLPVTDMAIVHHMILFGGVSTPSVLGSRPRSNSDMCYRGSIVYAWARTGQETPVGLDFDTSERAGDAYAVGPGTSIQWLAVQIHYQQFKSKVVLDSSGIRLWFRDVPPKNPLAVEIMLSAKLRIPPRVYFDECIACRATSGGRAVAYRNHAHRLARAIWSEHYDALGRRLPNFGNMSAQQPQIFRLFNTPVDIQAGHTFLLHCEYDARQARHSDLLTRSLTALSCSFSPHHNPPKQPSRHAKCPSLTQRRPYLSSCPFIALVASLLVAGGQPHICGA